MHYRFGYSITVVAAVGGYVLMHYTWRYPTLADHYVILKSQFSNSSLPEINSRRWDKLKAILANTQKWAQEEED